MQRASRWLELAHGHLGQERGPWLAHIYEEAGEPTTDLTTPWCAAFVGAMLYECGLPNTGSLAASSYLKYGDALSEPEVGCIAVLEHHVGFVDEVGDGHVIILGGNQGHAQGKSAVTAASYRMGSVVAWRWPIAKARASDLQAHGSRTIAKGTTDQLTGWAATVTSIGAISQNPVKSDPFDAVAGATAKIDQASGLVSAIQNVTQMAGHHLPALIILAIGLYLISSGSLLKIWRTMDHNNGWHGGRQ